MFKNSEESVYGLNTLLRDYCGYPYYLPLSCHYEHGIYIISKEPILTDLKTSKRLMLVTNKMRLQRWLEVSSIPSVICGSLFVHYRRKNKIQKSLNAQGSVVFPSHSTDLIKADYKIDDFCGEIIKLPLDYHPITICLHWHDFVKGLDVLYKKYGFEVVTAGSDYGNPGFAKNFYSILSEHNYAISNEPGSYAFYAVELGIPFFLIGSPAVRVNHGNDPNVPHTYTILDWEMGRKFYNIFNTGPIKKISDEQSKFVLNELGVDDCLTPKDLKMILLKNFWNDKTLCKYTLCYYKNLFFIEPVKRAIIFCGLKCVMKPIKNRLKYVWAKTKRTISELKCSLYFRKESLREESSIFTHLSDQEKIVLHSVVKNITKKEPPVAVEIGSYLGASSCFIASALERTDGVLYCIDTWQNQTMPDGERDTFNEFLNNVKKYRKVIVPLRGWSDIVIKDLEKKEKVIDFLFIDGDHSYESCKRDWELYRPLMKPGSIVAFHDTGWADGVKRVIKEQVSPVSNCLKILPNMQVFKIKMEKINE